MQCISLEVLTVRLQLRPISAADDMLLFELDSDPEVMRWLSGGPGTPLDVVREHVIPGFLALSAQFGVGCWCVFERESGDFCGWVSLRPGHSAGDGGELGYRFRRVTWGRGFATEAASAILERAFESGHIRHVFGTTYEANLGSRRVMEKLGMAHVRSYRPAAAALASQATYQPSGGDPWDGDDVEYAIERGEWLRGRA